MVFTGGMAEFGFEEEDVGEGEEGRGSFFMDIREGGASEFLNFTK
jgi:hypothetical protein